LVPLIYLPITADIYNSSKLTKTINKNYLSSIVISLHCIRAGHEPVSIIKKATLVGRKPKD
jgi:hypothetical protein